MTATIAGSVAILKTLYKKGQLSPTIYDNSTLLSQISRYTDDGGENYVIPVQTEAPQGVSKDAATAFANVAQGSYSKFTVTRTQYHGVARITDEALLAAKKDEHAMTKLWKNEMDGISRSVVLQMAAFSFSNIGNALAQVGSGQATPTITLKEVTDVVKFAVGMKVRASDIDPSNSGAVQQAGVATITAIDRSAGTLTISGNWTASIATLAANMYLFREGDFQAGYAGCRAWVDGSTAPGTLFGLQRNVDPIRLSGHLYAAPGSTDMDDAIIELCGRIAVEGEVGDMAFVNPRDMSNLIKFFETKVQYNKPVVPSKVNTAHSGFRAIEVETDNGTVKVLSDRNVPKSECYVLNMKNWELRSMGPAPHIVDHDSNQFLRVSNTNAQEVRVSFYGQQVCDGPVNQGRITGFGL